MLVIRVIKPKGTEEWLYESYKLAYIALKVLTNRFGVDNVAIRGFTEKTYVKRRKVKGGSSHSPRDVPRNFYLGIRHEYKDSISLDRIVSRTDYVKPIRCDNSVIKSEKEKRIIAYYWRRRKKLPLFTNE